MRTEIGNQLRITAPTLEVIAWCKEHLELPNPEYQKRARMGLYLRGTPQKLFLYEIDGNTLVVPFGCLRALLPLLGGDVETKFAEPSRVFFGGNVPLYEYQQEAVSALVKAHYGILQAPAGCGKTQTGIALACTLGVRTLWLTHTKDLLTQSRDRAAQYIGADLLGTITAGRVQIGEVMTFATIQTMCKLDLDRYRDTWDCIIVDECHRVSGTPTAVTQFSKVLNALRARHKYGLTATAHRSDGMIEAAFALLGEIVWTVPDEAVKDRVMTVRVSPRPTGAWPKTAYLNTDGTVNHSKLITYLTEHPIRNEVILQDLEKNEEHFNLILSDRLDHLHLLMGSLPRKLWNRAALVSGKMTSKKDRAWREQAIEAMRTGEIHYLFATYALAKEGLDIPRLDRLYLTTPHKDYAVIVQSAGRIARTFEGKQEPIVYDYVDSIRSLERAFKERCRHYRECGYRIG